MFRNRQWHNTFLYMVSHESFSDFDLKVIFQFLSKMANNRFVSVVSVLCQRCVPWWCIALDAHSEVLAGSVLIDRCVLAICIRQIKCYWNENVHMKCILCMSIIFVYHNIRYNRGSIGIWFWYIYMLREVLTLKISRYGTSATRFHHKISRYVMKRVYTRCCMSVAPFTNMVYL